jgi:hypothetical protein
MYYYVRHMRYPHGLRQIGVNYVVAYNHLNGAAEVKSLLIMMGGKLGMAPGPASGVETRDPVTT